MGILHGNKSMVTSGLVLVLDAANNISFNSNLPSGTRNNIQSIYTTEGNYEFEVPEGVTQISAVCIGGGGAGGAFSNSEEGGGGGGGGGLSYGTIAVTPDEDLEVSVGEGGECPTSSSDGYSGGDTYIARSGTDLLRGEGGGGGERGVYGGASGSSGEGGSELGYAGGGNGGSGGSGGSSAGGGGGAGGYSGNGGGGSSGTGSNGSGGGGGGGGGPGGEWTRGAGGGVGLLGEHSPVENGAGGIPGEYSKGGGGSGGAGGVGFGANKYGGGGAGAKMVSGSAGEDGAIGGVRIVYSTANDPTQVYPLKSNVVDGAINTGNTKWKYMGYGGLDSFATLKGAVSWSNGEFDFNGTSSYVELSGTSSLNYPITTSVTLSVFVKFDAVGALKGLITKNRSTSTQLGLWLNASSKLIFSANGSDLAGSTTLTTNTWYNLVGVQLSSISRKIYVNGVLDGTKTSSFGTTPSGTENWMLGQSTGQTEFLDGKISNATIYNRALTASEVLQNFNAHKGRLGL